MELYESSGVTSADGTRQGHFTGQVWMDTLVDKGGDASDGFRMYRVFFEPGARTHWHVHPGGQSLLVLAGRAHVGTRSKVVHAGTGDVVHTPAGEWHWHGASPDGYMIHLAVNPGGKTGWGPEEEVTDEHYHQAPDR